jgi:small redox-active disulfide protein 2
MENEMKEFKVLGSGCSKCVATAKLIEDVAKTRGVEVNVEKVTDLTQILGFGVMSTPGVVIHGKVVHAGGVPARSKVESWF